MVLRLARWQVLAALGVFLGGLGGTARAVTAGQVDSFSGDTAGWGSGAFSPAPPTLQLGGPGGAADSFLQLSSTGVVGPGGKLVLINTTQWAGDYLAAGVTRIEMDLNNLGSTDLSLRLYLGGLGLNSAVSTSAVNLAAGSGWQHVGFDISPAALTGVAEGTLAQVQQLRLFHGLNPVFPGENVAALLGVDNISAVPEPAPATLLALGLVAVAWARRRASTSANGRQA